MYLINGNTLVDYAGLVSANPNSYIPPNPSEGDLAHLGAQYVIETNPPSVQDDEIAYIDGTLEFAGALHTNWAVRAKTAEELAASSAKFAQAKAAKIAELKDACRQTIESGFTSSALGTAHTYDSALPQDQINLLGAKLGGVDIAFTCTDANGVKAQRFHTYAQISQVFDDGKAWVETNKAVFWTKAAQAMAATTRAALDAVTW